MGSLLFMPIIKVGNATVGGISEYRELDPVLPLDNWYFTGLVMGDERGVSQWCVSRTGVWIALPVSFSFVFYIRSTYQQSIIPYYLT